jgi:HlyD family secretion protein
LANWDHTEIISGLNEGDQIVMSLDQAGVKAGVRVQPEENKSVKEMLNKSTRSYARAL